MCGRTSKAKNGKKECVYVWEDRQGIKKGGGVCGYKTKKKDRRRKCVWQQDSVKAW